MKNLSQILPQDIKLVGDSEQDTERQEEIACSLKEKEETDSQSLFFRQLKNYKLLNPFEEIRYLKLAQQDDIKARDKMIACNQRLVLKIAKRYQHYGLELMDLVQEGILGLMTAIEKFDFNKETKFSTYASYWIEHTLSRAIMNTGRAIRLPVHVAQAVNKVQKVLRQSGNIPAVELAKRCGLSIAQVNELLEVGQEMLSYDQPLSKDGEGWLNTLADPCEDIQRELDLERLKGLLFKGMQTLKEKYRDVIIKRFGLDGEEPKTLLEVGEELNLSRERVRQIIEQCFIKMRVTLEQEAVFSG